jgi:hypothetical protein
MPRGAPPVSVGNERSVSLRAMDAEIASVETADYSTARTEADIADEGLGIYGDRLYRDGEPIGRVLWVTRHESGWRITYAPF